MPSQQQIPAGFVNRRSCQGTLQDGRAGTQARHCCCVSRSPPPTARPDGRVLNSAATVPSEAGQPPRRSAMGRAILFLSVLIAGCAQSDKRKTVDTPVVMENPPLSERLHLHKQEQDQQK